VILTYAEVQNKPVLADGIFRTLCENDVSGEVIIEAKIHPSELGLHPTTKGDI
jgi:hypothetical protein